MSFVRPTRSCAKHLHNRRPAHKVDGLRGIIRGKPIRTTVPDKTATSPLDRVNRQSKAPAPNRFWASDFTYVATLRGFVLDALEQALHKRRSVHRGGLVHHSDRGVQYVSVRYSELLAEAGIEPFVGSVGDS